MNKQIYVMRGDTPESWCEQKALGPFATEKQAMQAIRAEVQETAGYSDMLKQGIIDDWADQYHLLEYVRGFQPVLNISVKVSLREEGQAATKD